MALKNGLYSTEGFTFIELLIAMATGLVVLGAAYQSFQVQQRIYSAQEQVTEMQQQARAALDFMVQELRMVNSIVSLDATPGNGRITYVSAIDTTQQRSFYLNDSNTLIYQRVNPPNNPATQPLAENISSFTIAGSGSLLTITLTARSSAKDPNLGDYRTLTMVSRVRLRNM